MTTSTNDSAVNSEPSSSEADDFDSSSPLASGRVLHRRLQGESDQDYYLYIPKAGTVDAPVLVVVHDIDRDAARQAEAFAERCEKMGVVLVAPRFSAETYPNYQRLGRSRVSADERKSANEALDEILREVSVLSGVPTDRFHLFGFGSGGRFTMRYSMLFPERIASAVIAEPGAYTFPDDKRRFPQGIAPSKKRADFQPEPSRFLRVPMNLIEGERAQDDDARSHLEDADRKSTGSGDVNGRKWVQAMVDAAVARSVEPAVTLHWVEPPPESFAAFAQDPDLMEQVFKTLAGSSPSKESEGSADAAEGDRGSGERKSSIWPRVRRIAKALLVVGILAAAVTPVILWSQYRSVNVISRDAVVRGHVADVGAQLDGVVTRIEVDAGERVKAGQIIARLEDRQFEARRMRAHSQLQKARRELEVERLAISNERTGLQSGLRRVTADVAAARAEVRAAKSRADEALRRLELQRSLSKEGLVAVERVRAAETEYRTARALVSASLAESQAVVAGREVAENDYAGLAVREKRTSVLEAEIEALEAELTVAEGNLEGAVIRAPEDGAVIRRIVEAGGSTVVGQPIVSLWLGDELWVEAWIDEAEFGDIEVGSRAIVTFKSLPNLEFGGTVQTLAVSTDSELPDSEVPQPRHERMRDAPVVSARIKLDDTSVDLFPGLSADVAIRKKGR